MLIPVGLNVWSRLVEATFPYFDRTVGPFDSLWLPDHVQYNGHKVAEGWTLLVWALARYPDKRCGHEVLCNSFRNPAHVAKMVATAQALSGGWTAAPATYDGQHYRIENAHCEPRPDPIPPIMVGGHGEKHLLRVVAQHADWWNYPFRDHALYAHKQEVLKAHCREVGRDYDQIVQVVRVGILVAETERDVERLKAEPFVRPMADIRLAGTPAQVTETLQQIVRQGADRLVVNVADAPRPDGTVLFSETVLPYL